MWTFGTFPAWVAPGGGSTGDIGEVGRDRRPTELRSLARIREPIGGSVFA